MKALAFILSAMPRQMTAFIGCHLMQSHLECLMEMSAIKATGRKPKLKQRRLPLVLKRVVICLWFIMVKNVTSRNEFSKATKRQALARSGGLCEAVGTMYGLEAGKRCNAPLAKGVEFDHIILEANSKDNSLENCAAVCISCHGWKTRKHDIPMAAKTVRQRDKANGITKPKQTIKSAGFAKAEKRPSTSNKALPPRRSMYEEK